MCLKAWWRRMLRKAASSVSSKHGVLHIRATISSTQVAANRRRPLRCSSRRCATAPERHVMRFPRCSERGLVSASLHRGYSCFRPCYTMRRTFEATQMADIKLFSAGAVEGPLETLIHNFERETGHKVQVTFNTVGAIQSKLKAGE